MRLTLLLLLLVIASWPATSEAAPGLCADLVPPAVTPASAFRDLTADDLVRLRDFGAGESGGSPVGVSPDGTRAALEIRRGDPATNTFCVGLVVVDLRSGAATLADFGGQWVPLIYDHLWWAGYQNGLYKVAAPAWSPDGMWIAYLKRVGSLTQVWRVRPDGTGTAPVTAASVDVDSFAWAQGGHGIVFSTQSGLTDARRSIEQEGLSGFHYDGRFNPMRSDRPYPSAPIARSVQVIDMDSMQPRAATAAEEALIDGAKALDLPAGARQIARGPSGSLAWLAPSDPTRFGAPTQLHVRTRRLPDTRCAVSACDAGILGLWWSPDGSELRYLRREGWGGSETTLYRWKPGSGSPLKVLSTKDLVLGCQPAGPELLCGYETSTVPRHLVLIDPYTGTRRLVFNPNPEIQQTRLAQPERLQWTSGDGVQSFGDLVLPPSGPTGGPYPLIVVTYQTRGFLRGGTGDEYPIQLFASRGFAVLSFQFPASATSTFATRNAEEYQREDRKDWRQRRNVQASLEAAVGQLVARDLVDPSRIGLTGLSDGSAAVTFALVNSNLAAAAVISSCCEDPISIMTMAGPGYAARFRASGYPLITDRHASAWNNYSVAVNACRLATPLLMQLADREYRYSLESYASLNELGRPVDMYVFPDEYHIKWQPAHRLAIYQRNLDWFDFWLRSVEHDNPGRAAEYARWRQWRATPSSVGDDGACAQALHS